MRQEGSEETASAEAERMRKLLASSAHEKAELEAKVVRAAGALKPLTSSGTPSGHSSRSALTCRYASLAVSQVMHVCGRILHACLSTASPPACKGSRCTCLAAE